MGNSAKALFLITMLFLVTFGLVGCSSGETTQTNSQGVTIPTISTQDLLQKLGDPGLVILDARPKASYNGWQLYGEGIGGHIRGARDFPVDWIKDVKDEELKANLASKGLTPEKTVVVYHAQNEQSEALGLKLSSLGFKNTYIYKDFSEWLNQKLPMDKLLRYDQLVHPGWVNDLIQGKKPPTYDGRKYVIFEVSWGEPKDYNKGHIPGAIHLNTDELEGLPYWNFWDDNKLEQVFKKHGVTKDTLVITYSNESIAAARAIVAFMRAGVEDVRLLDGGWQAWTKGGYPVETKPHNPVPVTDFGTKIPVHPEYVISIDQAKELLKNPNGRLVSIRSWDEFIGKTSGYGYIKPKGEPKGAVWGHAGTDNSNMTDFHDQDGNMRNYHEITAMWKEWDITPGKKVAFYCGTGWRASEAWFYAYLMGWEDISLYDGGWFQWSMDPNNPVQKGDPRKPQ